MSHTTTIKSVPIRDIRALRSAVADLQASGVKCELVENQAPRLYYQNQHGKCDYVLKLHDSPYDIGFDKQKDGTYAQVTDLYGGHVQKQLGATCPMPNSAEGKAQASIGKLMQGYSKHAAINAAVDQGYMVENSYMDAENNVHLTISAY